MLVDNFDNAASLTTLEKLFDYVVRAVRRDGVSRSTLNSTASFKDVAEVFQARKTIAVDNDSAFLIEKAGGADVFEVDTNNKRIDLE